MSYELKTRRKEWGEVPNEDLGQSDSDMNNLVVCARQDHSESWGRVR
jgi:hypothetical protein